ncbi:11180_t:CDS:2 [Dentiscutata erythropus]|uniref:11180_t:CDS:1 n=1 Tax=Dentiscutata erythropus TaxID=1348616 RepID=A0A9N9CET3_9GLOM|nr:11180_t:CDS:2 [Dentiscutata erythropus]
MIFEHNETAYGQNLRGFDAFVPDAFGSNPAQMEQYYNQIYVYGPDPRFPISPATLAGAAAYKAVKLHEGNYHLSGLDQRQNHNYAINLIRESAANEANLLLQRFPLPGVDPMIVVVSAEAGAHRLYDHEHF